ncbi:hypothetical protein D2V17_08815 [Aurantiacibacter xanthus]|uniref:Uncharacterized protein n=1 Tax=Aurantiacibacter xanthus TaxID=1784712 RepID=A0A3A1P6D1_9SPHN|nr:hypothetical protein D2V17_08815 [Aurantiacibacter xanthus]
MRHGLSGTATIGRSGTRSSDYQEPKPPITQWNHCTIPPLNIANSESFGFMLTGCAPVDEAR